MMDAKYLAEIKARAEAAAVHEYDGINDLIYGRDVKALAAEVEQSNEACEIACASAREYCDKLVIAEKQIATLKKALRMALEDLLDAAVTPCSYCRYNPSNGGACDMISEHHEMFSCWIWQGVGPHQAQEQEGKK